MINSSTTYTVKYEDGRMDQLTFNGDHTENDLLVSLRDELKIISICIEAAAITKPEKISFVQKAISQHDENLQEMLANI